MNKQEAYKQYRSELGKLGQQALKERAAKGLYRGPVPLGFISRRDHSLGIAVLEPDPRVMPIIKEMFALHRGGSSVRAIQKFVRQKGLRTKRGKILSSSMTHYLLKNEVYAQWITLR